MIITELEIRDFVCAHGGVVSVTEAAGFLEVPASSVRAWARDHDVRRVGTTFAFDAERVSSLAVDVLGYEEDDDELERNGGIEVTEEGSDDIDDDTADDDTADDDTADDDDADDDADDDDADDDADDDDADDADDDVDDDDTADDDDDDLDDGTDDDELDE